MEGEQLKPASEPEGEAADKKKDERCALLRAPARAVAAVAGRFISGSYKY